MELSCGAVLYTIINNEIYFVIIKSIKNICGFPKGHQEDNETCKQTALREIKEEVGIDAIIDDVQIIFEDDYYIEGKVHRKIIYFIAHYYNQEIKLQKSELKDAYLLKYDDALNKLNFRSSKNILKKAYKYINGHIK